MSIDLSEELRGGRAVVHEGVLHLDRDAARSKISAFTLPSPYFWVLQIVRTACFAGATRVEFDVSVRSVEARFDASLDPAMLEDIWNVALDPRTTSSQQAVRYLALGVAAARALGPQSLTVRTGRVELQCATENEQLVQLDHKVNGTVISCVEKFRLTHIRDFFQELYSEPAEIDALKKHVEFAPLPVVANGELITVAGVVQNTPQGAVHIERVPGDEVHLYAAVGGVRVMQTTALRPVKGGGIGGWALTLESSALALDLSTMSLRGDSSDLVREMLKQFWRYFMDDPSRIEAMTPPQRIALFVLALEDDAAIEVGLPRLLFATPMFPSMANLRGGTTTEIISLQDTVVDDVFRYVTQPVPTSRPVALIEHYEIYLRLSIAGFSGRDLTQEKIALAARAANIARWEKQRPVKLNGQVVKRGPFQGTVKLTSSQGMVQFCKDGRVVQEVPTFAAPVLMQIDGPLKMNETFDEVLHTVASDRFTRELLQQVSQLIQRAGLPTDGSVEDDVATAAGLIGFTLQNGSQVETALARFEARPLFRARIDPNAFTYEAEIGTTKVLLTYLPDMPPYTSNVTIVYHGKQLTQLQWRTSQASWDVVVWCDELTPARDMCNVIQNDAFETMKAAFLQAESLAILEWYVSAKQPPPAPVEAAWDEVLEAVASKPHTTPPASWQPNPEDRLVRQSGELHRVATLIAEARGARRALIGDFMLNRLSLRNDDGAWAVRSNGASLGAAHPIAALRNSNDRIEQAFLASGAATAINAYYREFSDTQELHLQASLLTTAVMEPKPR